MSAWRRYAMTAGVAFVIGLLLGFFGPRSYENQVRPLPSHDGMITHETVTPRAPVQALNKVELRELREIPEKIAQDQSAAVLATGELKDDSGSRTAAAILDLDKGTTQIIQERPFAEFMSRWEAGAGFGLVDASTAKGARVSYTFARVWELYGSAQVEVFNVDRIDNRHPWNAMVWISARW